MLFHISATKYLNYPAWLTFPYTWEELPMVFNNPGKYVSKQWYGEDNHHNFDWNIKEEFISGPEGGGVIIHQFTPSPTDPYRFMVGKQWIGDAIFDLEQFQQQPVGNIRSSQVAYLTRRKIYLLEKLGVYPPSKTQYSVVGSYDHIELLRNEVFVALVCFRDKRVRNKLLDHFIELTNVFKMKLTPYKETPIEILTEKALWFEHQEIIFYWFKLETDIGDVDRVFSYLIYCALHLKKGNSALWGVQLAAQIEGKPQGYYFYHKAKNK
ncbi:MAG: hypothetical protein LBC74_10775 [Planctomycetaceae bacterium]|jgi:hypothetical protein|nr:hypothetical protein [Planctomycetaceae bacterium]